MKKLLLCLTLLGICTLVRAPVSAQDADAPKKQNAKLLQRIEDLEQKNAELQAKIVELSQSQNSKNREVQVLNDYAASFLDRVVRPQASIDKAKEVYEAQLIDLRKHLEQLSAKQAQMRDASVASAASGRVVANRLAEAELENRLRMLESQAMVDVLKAERESLAKKEVAAKEQALKQAEMLTHKRQEIVAKLRSQLNERRDSVELKAAVTEAEMALKEAYAVRKAMEAKTQIKRLGQIDERIAEASVQLAVAQIMQQNFARELQKVRGLMEISSNIERVDVEMEAVQQHLLELKKMASDREAEMAAKRLQAKAEMEQMMHLLNTQLDLASSKYGPEHPTVIDLKAQIQAFKNIQKK